MRLIKDVRTKQSVYFETNFFNMSQLNDLNRRMDERLTKQQQVNS